MLNWNEYENSTAHNKKMLINKEKHFSCFVTPKWCHFNNYEQNKFYVPFLSLFATASIVRVFVLGLCIML